VRRRAAAARIVPPAFTVVAVLAFWELAVWWTRPPKFLFCAPSDIVREAVARAGELAMATWNTAVAVACGFALSALTASPPGCCSRRAASWNVPFIHSR